MSIHINQLLITPQKWALKFSTGICITFSIWYEVYMVCAFDKPRSFFSLKSYLDQ